MRDPALEGTGLRSAADRCRAACGGAALAPVLPTGSRLTRLQTTFITVDKPENLVGVGGMSEEPESNGDAGTASAAPGNPVVARRVPGKLRRFGFGLCGPRARDLEWGG